MAPFRVSHAGQVCGERNGCRAYTSSRHLGAVHFFDRPGVYADTEVMDQQAPLIIIHVSNPASSSGKGSIIFLEYKDEDTALKLARKIARETGRLVTVHGEDDRLIEMIPPVTTH
jgi:hypothetical protein